MCKQQFVNIQTKETLDLEKVTTLPDNAMLKVKPELYEIWDFEKNDELGLDIWKMTKGSEKKAWWICKKCESCYDMSVDRKTANRNCPYCSSHRVNKTNSLESLFPEIARCWHPMKNGNVTPDKVTAFSNKKVWWLGNCGHEWDDVVSKRTSKNTGCPYCSGKRVLIGFNDLWTTHPHIAKLLTNPEDGYKYSFGSSKTVKCKCPKCETETKSKKIQVLVRNNGYKCAKCSDGISFGEKFIYNLLSSFNIQFENRHNFEWSCSKEYDFYLPKLNTIIEVHGEQHYKGNFSHIGGRTLEEEQENDKLKEILAKNNNIKNYITLDFRCVDINWIKNSIKNSDLNYMLNLTNLNWEKLYTQSSSSLTLESAELWNKGMKTSEIAKKLGLSVSTVISYLKRMTDIGLCNFNVNEIRYKTGHGRIKAFKQNVESLEIIKFNSLTEASSIEKVNSSTIKRWCMTNKINNGYRWMLEDNLK